MRLQSVLYLATIAIYITIISTNGILADTVSPDNSSIVEGRTSTEAMMDSKVLKSKIIERLLKFKFTIGDNFLILDNIDQGNTKKYKTWTKGQPEFLQSYPTIVIKELDNNKIPHKFKNLPGQKVYLYNADGKHVEGHIEKIVLLKTAYEHFGTRAYRERALEEKTTSLERIAVTIWDYDDFAYYLSAKVKLTNKGISEPIWASNHPPNQIKVYPPRDGSKFIAKRFNMEIDNYESDPPQRIKVPMDMHSVKLYGDQKQYLIERKGSGEECGRYAHDITTIFRIDAKDKTHEMLRLSHTSTMTGFDLNQNGIPDFIFDNFFGMKKFIQDGKSSLEFEIPFLDCGC